MPEERNLSQNKHRQPKRIHLDRKVTGLDILIPLILLSSVVLSGCSLIPLITGVVPAATVEVIPEPDHLLVTGPDSARDVALNFICTNFSCAVPTLDAIWVSEGTPPEKLLNASLFQYVTPGWMAQVSFPHTAPEDTIYTVKIWSEEWGFYWEGLVDAYGQIATTSSSFNEPTKTPEAADPEPSDSPSIETHYYRDDSYKIAIEYPADWSLTEISTGDISDAKALRLQKETWSLVIQYKRYWDTTSFGGGLPAGDVVDRGWATILGNSIPKYFVVFEGKDKVLFFGDRFEDLEFFIRLDSDSGENTDYFAVDIPDRIVDEVENIVASILRTGSPISPPTPTKTPYVPTPTAIQPTPTAIQPTPIPVPCNAISFQTDLTIKDGTVFAPNADFTKTWRLKNVGSCSWSTSYDLVFVEGDRMEGKKATALPALIRPGEIVDISIELTSPDKAGDYRGYWMLRSGGGEWFGFGKDANKAFWVDITVMEPDGNFEYDFALNFCAAIWRSEEMRLPCPGYTTSDEGFTQLLEYPKLENRGEDQPALWVHPNEEKYGWLEGIYPSFKIEEGDHFKTWVGCIKDYNKCSLKFYLDYEDENGKVNRLGEWIEEYDEEISIIDLDLSGLSGETVRFILGVEALTRNVEDSQGFWFVPRITQDD